MIAFVDIETSWQGTITVVGVYRPRRGTDQLVGEEVTADRLSQTLRGVKRIFSYNGSRFDLPVIHRYTGLDLAQRYRHHDLMFDCWAKGLYGGLKGVERTLGIHRDTEGLTGIDAMNLWERHRQGDPEALELLLRYNREDIENLEVLAWKLNILQKGTARHAICSICSTAKAETHGCRTTVMDMFAISPIPRL
ncbi:MAG: ribonuclease H-like domain-containing protein [Elusimicrobia bacterium]|nr:ribonuclease H-like domain-containing protein [Elusimicrobiota bacterium]